MKLGLLVVLVVAVVAPNLSEGRIVSKCELREKLGKAITLPKRFHRDKDKLLATVICQLERISNLNTSLVRVFGKRRTTTPKPTTTSEPPQTTLNTTSEPDVTNSTSASNQTAGSIRERREANASSEEADRMEMDSSPEEELDEEEDQCDEEELDEEEVQSDEEELDEEEDQSDEEVLEQDDDMVDDEDDESNEDDDEGDEDEQEPEESGKRKKRFLHRRGHRRRWRAWPRSRAFYGLFQLSDRRACDSSHRRSKNRCETTCDAFIDDDIENDIDCLVKTRHIRFILRRAHRQCRRIKGFFDECN